MIKPTIGRVVLFRRHVSQTDPFPAFVTKVWGDQCINVAGFDEWGMPFSQSSCRLIQDDEPAPAVGAYAEWMPYQKAQATKQAILTEADAAADLAGTPRPDSPNARNDSGPVSA